MTKSTKKQKSAFTFFEIGIVMLVISLIIVGVIGSRELVRSSKLNSARNATISSPVHDIEGLSLWLETTLKQSIKDSERTGNVDVTVWRNISSEVDFKQDAKTITGKRPKYIRNAINSLPAIKFNASEKDHLFISNFSSNTKMTLFILGKFPNSQFFIEHGPNSSSGADGFFFDAKSNTNPVSIRHSGSTLSANDNNDWFGTRTAIGIMRYDGSTLSYRIDNNSWTNETGSSAIETEINTLYIGSRGGNSTSNASEGNLGEVILFNRDLSDDVIDDIVEYLSLKWRIN